MSEIIRIGTRKSALALIQTHLIADELKRMTGKWLQIILRRIC